jgi:hypothetical protein
MTSAAGSSDGGRATGVPGLPRYSVALVQSELEMLNTPGNELSGFLFARPDLWRTEVFTERTFEAALGSANRFDCVILGFNAVYQSEAIQEALSDWTDVTGLLVLHQLKQRGLSFLPPDLTLTLNELREEVRGAVVHRHTRPEDEILLNWPEPVAEPAAALGTVTSAVMCYLETLEAGTWRTSLELESGTRRLPVLLRTSSIRRPRVVVCTLQLEPRKPLHAALLRNLITYCAAGWPEIAVAMGERGGEGADIARKLRVQGANAVELPLDAPGSLRFDTWPLRGVHEVVVGEEWAPADVLSRPDAREWLEVGNTLVRVGSGGLTFHHGASDAHLVGERWATWFHGIDHAGWHGGTSRDGEEQPGSIFGTRAILRVLELLGRDETRAHPERLGLQEPPAFAEPVVALLERRRSARPSFEATISTYAAALDVVNLLGGAEVAPELARYAEDWLREAFEDAADEDRFTIARSLADADLFGRALESLGPGPLPAVLATRLREGAVVCRVRPELSARRLEELPSADLDGNLLLAGEYIAARVAFAEAFDDHPGGELDGEGMVRALTAIGRFGSLAGQSLDAAELARVRPGVISTEARALIRYFDARPTSTHAILQRAQGVPATMVGAVLKAANAARAGEAAARAEEADVRAVLERRERTLRRARDGFGLLAVAAAVALFSWMLARRGTDLGVVATAFGLAGLLFVALALLLNRLALAPAWARNTGQAVAGGFWGIAGALAGLFRDDEEPGR